MLSGERQWLDALDRSREHPRMPAVKGEGLFGAEDDAGDGEAGSERSGLEVGRHWIERGLLNAK
jgi:hypothetical protein